MLTVKGGVELRQNLNEKKKILREKKDFNCLLFHFIF